jgi:hypothetical protein
VWEVAGPVSDSTRSAIVTHLKGNCRFSFDGAFRLTGDPTSFYRGVLLCELVLEPGTRVSHGRKWQELTAAACFYFLFRDHDGVLIPLTGGEGDVLLANRWLGLTLKDDAARLDYARFYYAFALTESPPHFRNIPRHLRELRFSGPVTEKQIWGIYGATWRFLVDPVALAMRIHFEPRGVFWRARQRAHLPMQFGSDLCDVDLKIWDRDGHITYHKTALIYRDDALAAEPNDRPGKIGRPRYISRREWLRTLFRNLRSGLVQLAYLAILAILLVASAVALALPLDLWGVSVLRILLDLGAGIAGIPEWKDWLGPASAYCIAYFALTTLLVLDIETVRNALLTWSPWFRRSALNEFLYSMIVRGRIVENGYRRGLWRRLRTAATWLVIWTVYLVCVFTSLQTSIRPELANDPRKLSDVMQVFGEQALLYIPVVFYYVGRKSLDPEKVALVSFWVLVGLQLTMGLLVIRRIHRYWASTASARVNEQVFRDPPDASRARLAPTSATST